MGQSDSTPHFTHLHWFLTIKNISQRKRVSQYPPPRPLTGHMSNRILTWPEPRKTHHILWLIQGKAKRKTTSCLICERFVNSAMALLGRGTMHEGKYMTNITALPLPSGSAPAQTHRSYNKLPVTASAHVLH